MEKKICCFAGHSKISTNEILELEVYEQCEELIKNAGVTAFWIGNYGGFDHLAARAVRRLKEKYSYIELDLVLPYITETINKDKEKYYKNYDCILMLTISKYSAAKEAMPKSSLLPLRIG